MRTLLNWYKVWVLIFAVSVTHSSQGQQYAADIEPNCVTCYEYGMGLACEVENLRGIADIVVQSLGGLRSPFQVDHYISCQMSARKESQAPQWLKDYQEKYRLYIKSAAESFGVPPQLLQCAFLKESVYNSEVSNSSSGAQGLCQIMPGTKDYIDSVLSSAAERRATGEIYDLIENPEMDEANESDQRYFKTLLNQDDLFHKWNQNFINLDRQGLYPYRSNDQIDIPSSFSSVGVKRPQNCIAAAALYFRDITSQLSVKIESTSREQILSGQSARGDENASLNLMLVLGAAYNAGPGTVNKLLKADGSSMTLQEMVETLESSKNKEMTDYMKSLRSCLSPGNFNPPERWYKNGGVMPPACEQHVQPESEVGLLPVRLWP